MRFYRLKVRPFLSGLGRLAALVIGLAQINLLFLPTAVGFAEVVDRIVAIVNDEVNDYAPDSGFVSYDATR